MFVQHIVIVKRFLLISVKNPTKSPKMNNKLKLLVVGDPHVGKTSLLLQYVEQTFSERPIATLGVDYKSKNISHNGQDYNLQIWDTAGQERLLALTASYYSAADGILLVYDVTEKDTYDNIKQWLQEIDRYAPLARKVLVGNKIDLNMKKVIDQSMAKDYAETISAPFIETSAKDGRNVADAFQTLVAEIVKRGVASHSEPDVEPIKTVTGKTETKTGNCGKCCIIL